LSSQNDHAFINLQFDAVYSVLISWKKTCGKTTTEIGKHQEGLLVAANIRGWRRVAADKDIRRLTIEEARDAGCLAMEEEGEE
jgi:hypothetical protein